jgi:hypothetical protein
MQIEADAIINAMAASSDDASLQRAACCALNNLSAPTNECESALVL